MMLRSCQNTGNARDVSVHIMDALKDSSFEDMLGSHNSLFPLNCGMVVDLKSGTVCQRIRDDLFDRQSVCDLSNDPDEMSLVEEWMRKLQPIEANYRYMQKLAGFTLTGEDPDRMFHNLVGPPSCGKSQFLECIENVNPYCDIADKALIVGSDVKTGAPFPEMTALRGQKCVLVKETREGDKLNCSRIQMLTGDATVKARRLYEEGKKKSKFAMKAKLLAATNTLAAYSGDMKATDERVRVLPFTTVFREPGTVLTQGEEYRDRELSKRIKSGDLQPALLRWMVEGAMFFYKEGLVVTESMKAAKEVITGEMDHVRQFMREACVIAEGKDLPNMGVYNLFKAWFINRGEGNPISIQKIVKLLHVNKYATYRHPMTNVTYIRNVKLRPGFSTTFEPQ